MHSWPLNFERLLATHKGAGLGVSSSISCWPVLCAPLHRLCSIALRCRAGYAHNMLGTTSITLGASPIMLGIQDMHHSNPLYNWVYQVCHYSFYGLVGVGKGVPGLAAYAMFAVRCMVCAIYSLG